MSEEKISPIKIYRLLPGKNCGECGVPTCMAFSLKIIEGLSDLELCPYLEEKNKTLLNEIVALPVKKVGFGEKKPLYIGGEKSLHRHLQRFYNPTAIGIFVDANKISLLSAIVDQIRDFKIFSAGEEYKIDFIFLSSINAPHDLPRAVEYLKSRSDMPLMIHSTPDSYREAADDLEAMKPLLCGADKMNIVEMIEISKKINCPIGVQAESVGELGELSRRASDSGCEVVLNPTPKGGLNDLLSLLIQIRLAAIEHGRESYQHPVLALPLMVAMSEEENIPDWAASLSATACILRYASAIVLRSLDPTLLTPVYAVRQGYFSNPREPAKVKPGLHMINDPDSSSHVILTTNYALTYYLVSGDLQAANKKGYLLVVDSQGMSVDNAIAGRLVDGGMVAKLIKESGVEAMGSSKTLIIPMGFSKLKGEIEEETGWEVLVGPAESSELPSYLERLKN